MLKISEGKHGKHDVTYQLEGRVVGPWVGELQQICKPLVRDGTKIALDLTDVYYADADGIALLSSLKARGAKLLHATPFVAEQLRTAELA